MLNTHLNADQHKPRPVSFPEMPWQQREMYRSPRRQPLSDLPFATGKSSAGKTK